MKKADKNSFAGIEAGKSTTVHCTPVSQPIAKHNVVGSEIHELKTWKEYFEEVFMGRKTFEVRVNDRGFKKGDILILKEWDKDKQEYTGRQMARGVSFILEGGQFGIEKGVVVMAIV